jgi:cytochrome c oxidase subunit III
MRLRVVQNVSALPTWGFSTQSTPWWGTIAFIALEGTAFALAIGTYIYLYTVNAEWPLDAPPPNHWPGTLMLIVLLASAWPNHWINRVAHEKALPKVQVGLVIISGMGLLTLAIRAFEFAHLNVSWDQNAYGSILWVILGLHATHLVTDVGDTLVLTVLMFTRHATPRRFSDVTDNAFYWYFVVLSWLPLYFLIYWVPRL